MADALGLIAMLVFIACVITLAAAVTWIVVKISPSPEDRKAKREQQQAG